MNKEKLIVLSFFTGFLGDLLLQILIKNTNLDWGLKKYFAEHHTVESMFIAGGMMTLFYIVYLYMGIPLKWYYLALAGIILDLVFRVFKIFPSLDGYYSHLNYFWSAVWGVIPMLIPFWIYKQNA